MNKPNLRPCSSSHALTASGASGAVPYSMLLKISSILLIVLSNLGGRVALSVLCERRIETTNHKSTFHFSFTYHCWFRHLHLRAGASVRAGKAPALLNQRNILNQTFRIRTAF